MGHLSKLSRKNTHASQAFHGCCSYRGVMKNRGVESCGYIQLFTKWCDQYNLVHDGNCPSLAKPCPLPHPLSGAKRVQEVDGLRGEKGAKQAAETLGSGETSLGQALWCCSNLYSDIKLRLSHKRLMIFTCRDSPHGGDAELDKLARTKAGDLRETGAFGQRLPASEGHRLVLLYPSP